MKYYLIAGEASGDLHGSNLLRELKKLDPDAHVRAWGGELIQEQGAHIVKHYRDLAFMGFAEVVMNLRTILRNISFCKEDILKFRPDAIILVDYPGFNLRIAEFAHENKIKVFYYISPQVWAWKQSRVKKIRQVVDKMMVILPFEKDFYKKFDYEVDFVGHPLLDAIEQQKEKLLAVNSWKKKAGLSEKPLIGLLPGSRTQEISNILPLMLTVVDKLPEYQFAIAAAPSQPLTYYKSLIGDKNIPVIADETYSLLSASEAALVTSGTATLETALLNIPEVVCYKGGKISYHIAKRIVDIKYISLVNLIMDREVVKELIQDDLNEETIFAELKKVLTPEHRSKLLADYSELRTKLGGSGASEKAARIIFENMEK
ncbi:MAG: lipid-A-disaccharide synthase [Bacteroidota bacterium]